MVMLGGGGGGNLSVDMIVNAIAQGFDKLISQVNAAGQAVDNANKLIIDSSGRVSDVSAKTQQAVTDSAAKVKAAKEAEAKAFQDMSDRMASSSALAQQKAREEAAAYDALAKQMAVTGAAFMAAAAAGGALLYSSVQLAARVETLGVVTRTLGANIGYSESEITSLEKSVSGLGITLQAARQSIARMIQGDLDLAKATDLARLAQDAAVIAGINSSEAFDRLVTAISSGQVEMLRTMGIMVTFEQGYKDFASANNKTVESLTNHEKAQARLQIVLSAGKNIAGAYADAMDTAGKKVTSLDRHIEESKRMLGEIWLPVYASVVDTITSSLEAWEGLSTEQKNGISAAMGYGVALSALEGAVFLSISAVMKLAKAYETLKVAMAAGTATIGVTAGIAAIVAVFGAMAISIYESNKAIKENIAAFKEEETQIRQTASSYAEYEAAARKAAMAQMEKTSGSSQNISAPPPGQGGNVSVIGFGRMGPVIIAQVKIMTEAEYELARSVEAETKVEQLRADRAAGWVIMDRKIINTKLEDTEATKEQAKAYSANALAIKGSMEIMAKAVEAAVSGQLKKSYEDLERTLGDLKKEHGELSLELVKSSKVAYGANKEQVKALTKDIKDLNVEIKDASEKYGKNSDEVKNLTKEHGNLTAALEKAKKGGYGPDAEKVKELNEKLKENEAAQAAAAAATKEATRQYVFQQVAAGLDAKAQLELARTLGILDENTYQFNKKLLDLKQQYQEGKFGATESAAATEEWSRQTDLATKAYERLIAQNVPVNAGSIALAMAAIAKEEEAAAEKAGNVATAIPESLDQAAGGAAGAASNIDGSMAIIEESAKDAKAEVDFLQNSIDKLHGKTVTVKVTYTTAGGAQVTTTCFVAGTLVNVPGGLKPIEELRVGNIVIAYDEETGSNARGKVVARIISDNQKVYEVATNHGSFHCTELHRWYTRYGWKETRALSGQDEIRLMDGSYSRLVLAPRRIQGKYTVYNLTVEKYHTYFVNYHLVHNMKGQYGLNEVIPPGYPNDSFPVMASSGERVVIIPKRTVAGLTPPELHNVSAPSSGVRLSASGGGYYDVGTGDSPMTVMDNSLTVNQFHNYSKAAAAISLSMVMNSRLRRLSERMG